jgi:hypothetical protein
MPPDDITELKERYWSAAIELDAAEQACKAIPLWLPPFIFERRLDRAMARWRKANVALFDAQCAMIDAAFRRST